MNRKLRIGILTGGGDVPGLNPAIQQVTREACARGWDVVGIRNGWAGLLGINPDDDTTRASRLMTLDPQTTRGIDRFGGTVLHTARLHPDTVREADMPDFLEASATYDERRWADMTSHILRVIEHLQLDVIIPIGGDGTLSYAARLGEEGVPVLAIPKTMDNDVQGTDVCIGFPTAITRSIQTVHDIRSTASAEESIGVIELMGRHSGETALMAGHLGSADRTAIAEVPVDVAALSELLWNDLSAGGEAGAVMVVSEGAQLVGIDADTAATPARTDKFGNKRLGGVGEVLARDLTQRLGVPAFSLQLAYLMRAGAPVSQDSMIARAFGTLAVELIASGQTGRMTALQEGKYTSVPVSRTGEGAAQVDVDRYYDAKAFKPRITRPGIAQSLSF
ncbi:6-phosphofructokinase [Pyruvatibacter sp. HU-CL02332]|uniref:6-phosphofructokinase n=1 Tax=Pyruvatibacter sp. HU-CL02332 TaxID=3127650 RepID=UPI0031062A37